MLRDLGRPSTVALIVLIVVIIAMATVALFGDSQNEQFFGVMSDIVKIIGGGWAGATFGERFKGGRDA